GRSRRQLPGGDPARPEERLRPLQPRQRPGSLPIGRQKRQATRFIRWTTSRPTTERQAHPRTGQSRPQREKSNPSPATSASSCMVSSPGPSFTVGGHLAAFVRGERSQSLMVSSALPEARVLPSGEKATDQTESP